MKNQKVCIIGGGLAGLITAKALSKLNLKIDLVIGASNSNTTFNRTTAISQDNYDYFKEIKITKSFNRDFWPCSKMNLFSETKNSNLIEIFQLEQRKKGSVLYMFNNSIIKKKLLKKIKNEKLISIKKIKNVSDINSSGILKSIKLEKKKYSKYNLVIICTGTNSDLVKKVFDKSAVNFSYKEVSITTILKHSYIKNNNARQLFLNNGILALLPLSNTETSIVWSVKKKFYEKNKFQKGKFLKNEILFYSKKFIKNIKFISKLNIYDLNFIMRKNYYKDRILLFGDALHVVHPLAGQGLNMSIRDLMSLKKILKNKIDLGLDVGTKDVLLEFSNESKPRNFAFSMGINLLKNSFNIKNKFAKDLRNKTIISLNKNKYAKDVFFKLANEGLRF